MMNIKLVGVTKKGISYDLELKDCPVRLNDRYTMLVNKENSPILITDSIGRAVEGTDICELDRVYSKGRLIGYIVYNGGFYVWNHNTDEMTPIGDCTYDRIERNLECSYPENTQKKRSYIRWKSNDVVYGIHELLTVNEDRLFICTNQLKLIHVSNSRLWTGLQKEDGPIFFGDAMDNGLVVFENYKPMILSHGDELLELEV